MKNIFTRLGLVAGLVGMLSAAAFAQATTMPQQQGGTDAEGRRRIEGRMRKEGRMGGERRGGGGGFGRRGGHVLMGRRALRQLNLSDTQSSQLREIEARYGQSFKTGRQEMRQLIELRQQGATLTPEQQQRAQQLRTEARSNAERMHAEILAMLTTEQRDQLKRMREEVETRRKERREKRVQPDDDEQ